MSYFCWLAGVLNWSESSAEELQDILDEEDNVKTRIIFAREELKVWRCVCHAIAHVHDVPRSPVRVNRA